MLILGKKKTHFISALCIFVLAEEENVTLIYKNQLYL